MSTSSVTWDIRKQATIDLITSMNEDGKILLLADKLSNMRSLYNDYMIQGDKVWDTFSCKDLKKQYWYYQSIADKLKDALGYTCAFSEYQRLIQQMFNPLI